MTAVADQPQERQLSWLESATHVGIAAGYFLLAQLGFRVATVHPVVASIWPPAGLALAVLLLFGLRFWPGILLGAVIANGLMGISLPAATMMGIGNTLAAVAGTFALRRFDFQLGLPRPRDALLLLAIGALCAPLIAATVGASSLHFLMGVPDDFGGLWLTWWSGDAIGVMLVTSLLVAWVPGNMPELTPWRIAEKVLIGTTLLAATVVLMGVGQGYEYAILPLVGWAALRQGPRGASLAAVVVAAVAIWMTVHGQGSFIGTGSQALWRVQLFLALVAACSLVVGSMAAAQVKVSDALRGSELRFHRMFQHAGIGIAIVQPDGRIAQANPAFHGMLGFSGAELTGRTLAEISHPEDWAAGEAVIKEVLAGRPIPYRVVKRYLRRDGTVFWGKVTATHIPGCGKGPGYAIGLIEDISQQRAAQEALARDEQELRRTTHMLQTLIEAAPVAILAMDTAGRVRKWNRAAQEMFGWSESEVIGQIPPFLPAGALEEFHGSVRRLLAGEPITGLHVARSRRDGVLLHLRLCAAPTRSPAGVIDGFIALIEDVTERKSIGEQLKQAQKMEAIGQLTGGIAHDFNNILTIVITNAALLADQIGADQPEIRGELTELQRAALRGADLIRKLMAFSRKHPVELREMNLADIISDTERALRRLLPESIEISCQVDPDEAFMVRSDASAVEQILFNLATNARDAMSEGGTLRLGVYRAWLDDEHRRTHGWGRPGEYVVRAVSDTGCAMSPETRARIFDPFFTTKEPGKGTGLGMAMVYGLMKQHNGYIGVYSEPGQGTTLRLYFPAVSGKSAALGPAPVQSAPAGGIERILVVDDEDGIRRSMVRVLSRAGYTVEQAANGESALALLNNGAGSFDLMITDLVMPRLGGLALYEELCRRGSDMRVIMMTGHTPEDITVLREAHPELKFLSKPWSVTDLLGRVREALDGSKPSGPSGSTAES